MTNACPLCSGELLSRGVDADFGLTRCQSCNARFELSSLARAGGVPEDAPPIQRGRVPMPPAATLEEDAGRLHLQLRVERISPLFAMLVLLILGVLALFTIALLPQEAGGLLVIFASIGALGIYAVAASWLNSRHILATPGQLVIWIAPLSWRSKIRVRGSQLAQLYCKTREHEDGYGGFSYTYEVHAILADRSRLRLLKGLATLPQALWIEQEIERFLGIRDEPVLGSSRSLTPPS